MKKTAKKAAKAARKTGTTVAIHKATPPAPPQTFLEFLHRAATDPAVDIGKMQAILDMRAAEEAREAKRAFDMAMTDMQPRLPSIKKTGQIVITDKNDKTKIIQSTPYAKWDVIHKIITPILAAHRFNLTFRTGRSPDGLVSVTGVLARDGHREETTLVLQTDSTGSKNNVQGVGSSISYGKRYAASSLLNLNFEGEDTDGHDAAGIPDTGTITPAQVKEIEKIARDRAIPHTRITNHASKLSQYEIATLDDIPAKLFTPLTEAMKKAPIVEGKK